jgi:hypothetical protein
LIWDWVTHRLTSNTVPIGVGDIVTLTYTAQYPFEVVADSGAAPAIELVESVEDLTDVGTAVAVAQGKLARAYQSPRTFEIETTKPGLKPGQIIGLNSAYRQTNANALITRVEISLITNTLWSYRAEATTGVYTGSGLDFWRSIGGGMSGGTAPSITFAPGPIPGVLVTPSPLTKVDDTNITLTLGGSPSVALLADTSITVGFQGTLAPSRLNSNVVHTVTNDVNVVGSIGGQNLSLGWNGQLQVPRGGTGRSVVPAGQVLFGNGVNPIQDSPNLSFDGSMLSTHTFRTTVGNATFEADANPAHNFTSNLGGEVIKYRTIHAAELFVDTLVAQDVMSTIGGEILTIPTSLLHEPIGPSETTILVQHNQASVGDVLWMEGRGQFEMLLVTGGPTLVEGEVEEPVLQTWPLLFMNTGTGQTVVPGFTAAGFASGLAIVVGYAESFGTVAAVGTAHGGASVDGFSLPLTTSAAVGTAAGSATATAVGDALGATQAAGTATGTATAIAYSSGTTTTGLRYWPLLAMTHHVAGGATPSTTRHWPLLGLTHHIAGTPGGVGSSGTAAGVATAGAVGEAVSAGSSGELVFTSSGTWTWPDGVTSASVEAIGGGGGGGGASGNPATGGGGKGGGYARRATITKGAEASLTITVGSGGTGGAATAGTGGAGGYSEVVQGSTVILRAPGGAGGAGASGNSTNGAGGVTENGTAVGSSTAVSGAGGTGVFTSGSGYSGAGGGAASFGSPGSAPVAGVGGVAGSTVFYDGEFYAGNGADGVDNSSTGAAGNAYGGGGSGGKANNPTDRPGGAGAPGIVVVKWPA